MQKEIFNPYIRENELRTFIRSIKNGNKYVQSFECRLNLEADEWEIYVICKNEDTGRIEQRQLIQNSQEAKTYKRNFLNKLIGRLEGYEGFETVAITASISIKHYGDSDEKQK